MGNSGIQYTRSNITGRRSRMWEPCLRTLLVWSNFEEETNITAAVPGPFKAICTAALVNRVSVFNLDVCTNTEAVVNNLCYTIARSRDAGRKNWLRGQVKSLLVPPCDHIPIPPGCL
jgi:hypothetical protein